MRNVALVFIVLTMLVGAISAQIWDPDSIAFDQMHIDVGGSFEMYSTAGLVTLGYMPDMFPYYVNIVCPCLGYLPHWMVRNLYLPDASWIATYQWISYQFDMTILGAIPGVPMEAMGYRCYLTDTALLAPPDPIDYDWAVIDTFTHDAEGIDYPDTLPGLSDDEEYPEFIAGDEMFEVEYRGCRMRNVDLDDQNHPDTDTYAGDKNACGPASAANSLKWLSDVDPDVTITDDIRTVLEELSSFMGRARNGGVTPQQLIRGKLDYIAAKGLNISVKFQSYYHPTDSGDIPASSGPSVAKNMGVAGRFPTWEWLVSEVQDSEDVEILYNGRKSNGDFWGHAAVVSGIEVSASGRKTIKIKHDRRQRRADSTRTVQEDLGIYIDGYGRMRIRRKNAVITGVVSESPGDPYVAIDENSRVPDRFDIRIHPNPFNSSVTITVGEGFTPSRIEIYDIAGRMVAEIPKNNSPLTRGVAEGRGVYEFVWQPDESVGSGVYLVRTTMSGNKGLKPLVQTKRVVYLK